MDKILTIRNSHIATLPKILTYNMTFAEARMRDRFFALAQKKADEVEKYRLEICRKFAEKGEDGEPRMKDSQFIFPAGNTEVYQELADLFNEDCKIDFPPSMATDIGGIKRLIELSTVLLTPQEQNDAKTILEAFEHIEEAPAPDPLLSTPPKKE